MGLKYFFSFFLILPICIFATPRKIDSLSRALARESSDTGKAKLLRKLSAEYQMFKPDTALQLAQKALLISRRINFRSVELAAINEMASAYRAMGNYPKALKYYLEQIKLAEKYGNDEDMIVVLINISNVYFEISEPENALIYGLRGLEIIEKSKLDYYRIYSYLSLGDIYLALNEIEKSLYYTNKVYAISVAKKDSVFIGACLNSLGNIYSASGAREVGLAQYRQAIPFLKATKSEVLLCETYMGISNLLYLNSKVDSGIYYAKESFLIARRGHFDKRLLTACNALTNFYSERGNVDSAFSYQSILLEVKDTIYSQERVKQIQNLTLDEDLRQKEIAELQLQETKERKKRLQLLLVGLLIPLSFLISILLSRRKIRPKIVEFSGIFSLLLFFEYITLLIHPWVMEVTHHTPIYEIIIFVTIAAIITPSHHHIEQWMLSKLTLRRSKKHEH